MGTYGKYVGYTKIPKEQKAQFNRQIKTILNRGGMMGTESVSMFGKTLTLLSPVDPNADSDEKLPFSYNYFEDRDWETACYNSETADFGTNKIGSYEFNEVCMAAYQLYGLYTDKPGYIEVNGDVVRDPSEIVAWINYLFDKDYTLEKRKYLWDIVECYVAEKMDYNDEFYLTHSKLQDFIPKEYWKVCGGVDLADLINIIYADPYYSEDEEPSAKVGTYPYDVWSCKKAISDLKKEDPQWTSRIESLVRMPLKERKEIATKDNPYGRVAESSLILHARVLLYIMAQLMDDDGKTDKSVSNMRFWSIWMKCRHEVYRDESVKEYAPPELVEMRRKMWRKSCGRIRTTDFLKVDPWVPSYRIPDEVKDLPKYYVSDDERLYWWDGSDDVCISNEMDKWLTGLAKDWRSIVNTPEDDKKANTFLPDFMEILDDAERYYHHIYAFKDMFYEFVRNGDKKEYRAAVEVFRRLVNDELNRKTGEILKCGFNWDLNDRRVSFNPARLKLRRYLSVMANKMLREKYFRF